MIGVAHKSFFDISCFNSDKESYHVSICTKPIKDFYFLNN